MLFKSYMKTMKTYYIPETELVRFDQDAIMYTLGEGSDAEKDASAEAPARHRVGSLGPSY